MTLANGLEEDGLKGVSSCPTKMAYLVPATALMFEEEFRPVNLERYCYGYPQGDKENDFQFDNRLNTLYFSSSLWIVIAKFSLLEIIQQHSCSKPTLIFCSTQKGAQQAAQSIVSQYDALQKAKNPLPWTRHNTQVGWFVNATLIGKAPFTFEMTT
jgi:hypothetical protein